MHASLRSLQSLLATLAASALVSGAAVAAPVLQITGPSSVASGSGFTLSVVASGVTDLYGYQFDVHYDASKFRAVGVGEGAFLSGGGATFFDGGSIDNGLGTLSFIFGTLIGAGPGVSGDGTLATLSFTGVGNGVGSFSLADVVLLDSALGDVVADTASLDVMAVPEPAALGLFGVAMGLLAATRRRRPAAQVRDQL